MTTMNILRKSVRNSFNIVSSGANCIWKHRAFCWPMVHHVRNLVSINYHRQPVAVPTQNRNQSSLQNSPRALRNERWRSWHQPLLRNLSTTSGLASPQLIYQGPLTPTVKAVKFISLSTTIMSAGIIPLVLTYGESGVLTTIGVSFASIMMATPILLHWVSRSYITELSLDKATDTYTAKTVTFFLREATHTFKADDVIIPPIRNIFTSFAANGRPFLVDPRAFSDRHQISKLMGHDQSLSQEDVDTMMKKMKDDED